MTGSPSAEIAQIEYWPVDIPITDPFVVATGTRVVAENVFVHITLGDGTCGYGEAAPFPEVGGEDRETCLNALAHITPCLLWGDVFRPRIPPPFRLTKQKREPPFEKTPPSHLTSHLLRCTFHISHYPYRR